MPFTLERENWTRHKSGGSSTTFIDSAQKIIRKVSVVNHGYDENDQFVIANFYSYVDNTFSVDLLSTPNFNMVHPVVAEQTRNEHAVQQHVGALYPSIVPKVYGEFVHENVELGFDKPSKVEVTHVRLVQPKEEGFVQKELKVYDKTQTVWYKNLTNADMCYFDMEYVAEKKRPKDEKAELKVKRGLIFLVAFLGYFQNDYFHANFIYTKEKRYIVIDFGFAEPLVSTELAAFRKEYFQKDVALLAEKVKNAMLAKRGWSGSTERAVLEKIQRNYAWLWSKTPTLDTLDVVDVEESDVDFFPVFLRSATTLCRTHSGLSGGGRVQKKVLWYDDDHNVMELASRVFPQVECVVVPNNRPNPVIGNVDAYYYVKLFRKKYPENRYAKLLDNRPPSTPSKHIDRCLCASCKIQTGSGMSVAEIKRAAQKANQGVQLVLFDWDFTLSTCNGLFFPETGKYAYEEMVVFYAGGPVRLKALQTMFAAFRSNGARVKVLSSNGYAQYPDVFVRVMKVLDPQFDEADIHYGGKDKISIARLLLKPFRRTTRKRVTRRTRTRWFQNFF